MRVREKNCNGGEFRREQNMLLVVGVQCHANHSKSKQEKAGCCIKVSHSEDCQLESKLN